MGVALADEATSESEVVTFLANAQRSPVVGSGVEVETTEELEREALARADRPTSC